jgi:hypothetical protein
LITEYHAKLYAHELSKRHSVADAEKLAGALLDALRAQYARLGDGAFDELKGRLKPVCHRTLRRQVVEYVRYTNRIPITQEFVPTE